MLIFIADNHDITFQMLPWGQKEFVQLHKVLDLNSGNNFNERIQESCLFICLFVQ